MFFISLIITALYFIARFIIAYLRFYSSDTKTIQKIQTIAPELGDGLLSAWELSPNEGISTQLIEEHKRKIESILSRYSPLYFMPIRQAARRAGVCFALLSLVSLFIFIAPPHILLTQAHRISDSYSISEYNNTNATKKPLTPSAYPQFGDFDVTCTYPSYTGLGEQNIQSNPSINAPAGTNVEFSAASSAMLKKAELSFSWGENIPCAINKNKISSRFKITRDGSYRIIAESPDGISDPEPPEYAIKITPDRPPSIEITSPQEDLIIDQETFIPVIYEQNDDFGISKIELIYKINDNPQKHITIQNNSNSRLVNEYNWTTASLGLTPADKVLYYLQAWDNDTVTGPKSSQSRTLALEIANYMKEHDAIENDLKKFRDTLVNMLSDQTLAKQKLEEARSSTDTFHSLAQGQQKLLETSGAANQTLDNIVSQMQNDPLTDFSTLNEYKGMQSRLGHLKNNAMKDAVESLKNMSYDNALKNENEIISELENLSLLSEDIWQYQRMRDLLNAGSDLKNESDKLIDQLTQQNTPSELKKTLNKINELMDTIAQQLSRLEHELPEDFINSPAIKQINMQETKNAAEDLARAIENGDWEKAKALASSLKESLESMLSTMREQGENIGFSQSGAEKMMSETDKYETELQSIISEQKEALRNTEKIDNARKQSLFKQQENMLAELFIKQKQLIEKTNNIASQIMQRTGGRLEKTKQLMEKVLSEFKDRRVYYSQKYLEDIISDLSQIQKSIDCHPESPTVSLGDKLHEGSRLPPAPLCYELSSILSGEKEILLKLKTPSESGLLGARDKETLLSLGKTQQELSAKTKSAAKTMEEFSRKSSAISPETFDNIRMASDEMTGAANNLHNEKTHPALESEKKALEHLESSLDGVRSAKTSMSEQGEKSGKGAASPIQVRSSGGLRNAPVKLPKATDYKPPRQFRQEIMDALKEKYPAQYESIIKEYFKKLTE